MDKKEEFDLDFDFEKEYGFDPSIMESDYDDVELDLSDDFLSENTAPEEEAPAPIAEEPAPEPEEPELDLNSPLFDPDEPELDLNSPLFDPNEPGFELNDSLFAQEAPEADNYYAPQEPQWEAPAEPQWDAPAEPEEEPIPQEEPQAEEPAPAPAPRPRRRRRKKSKLQQFKETLLPLIIAGVTVIMCLIFIIGSVSRGISEGNAADESAKNASESAENEAQQEAAEVARILAQAEALAAGYDYEAAIAVLDSYSGEITAHSEMVTAKASYSQQLTQLVEWNKPSEITNLSFHVLIADPGRAFTNAKLGTKYNRNFVTTDEFEKILDQLYSNGYVLVDLDDIVQATTNADGTVTYSAGSIYLPSDKKPIMLTETLVNYYNYMVDSDNDNVADAGGAGFANKLVLQNGEIKAQMVTSTGETEVGNYDFVPILEEFIKEHPDFSYKGARALLAVTGEEGIFGYRINSGDAAEVSGAKEIVAALREQGYTIGCFTYANADYSAGNAVFIQNDLQKWSSEITPVLGNVDILVFAAGVDLAEYTGNKYNVLYSSGFRYFIGASSTPWAEVTNDYFHQKRLMVTGNQMAYSSSTFSKYFNAMSVLNEQRGTVPN